MGANKCPLCGSMSFYVKDPADEYETHEFDLHNGEVAFGIQESGLEAPPILDHTDTFCNKCAWHGEFITILK